jgi:Holliday junction resolvasome RuvABC endonuclease subunit
MTLVLGIDPGPTNNGYAVLDFTIPSAPVWHAGGVTGDIDSILVWLSKDGEVLRPRLVIVEQARALHNPMANIQAMGTAWAGGCAYGLAKARGYDVRALGVNEWRQALVGHSRKGDDVDAKVKNFLITFVRQFPIRSNNHARDAAGVACVGFRQWQSGWDRVR